MALAIATFAVFWPVIHFGFVDLDDYAYVKSNPHVQTGLNLNNIAWAFRTGYEANWHPITWISHMLDVQLFGPAATGPHLVNLLLHTANTLLLFIFLRAFTGAYWRSAFVAALFALHPLHVESVAWIAERKDVLSTFFALLTILVYCRIASSAATKPLESSATVAPNHRARSLFTSRPYWLPLVFFALGLMSKPMLVTLPFVLLLLDYWPLQRLHGQSPREFASALFALCLEKLPFFLLAAASSVVAFLAQKQGGAVQKLTEMSISGRLENATVSYARYLGKTFWPADLCALYPHPGHWPLVTVALALLLLIVLSVAALFLARRFPFVPAGWFWFVGTLVPVIGLVQIGGQAMADRYTYIPLIGFFIVVVWGANEVLTPRLPKSLLGVLVGLVLLACALQTRYQLRFWQGAETLFQRALAVTEHNPLILEFLAGHYYNLGNDARDQGRISDAFAFYRKAVQLHPPHSQLHNNLGLLLQGQGRIDDAIQEYLLSIKFAPTNVNARNNLAVAFNSVGKLDEAIAQLAETLRLTPNNPAGHNNLGALLVRKGQFKEAIVHYREAIRLSPGIPAYHNNLADALARDGRVDEAIAAYRQTLMLNPNDPVANQRLRALGNALP